MDKELIVIKVGLNISVNGNLDFNSLLNRMSNKKHGKATLYAANGDVYKGEVDYF